MKEGPERIDKNRRKFVVGALAAGASLVGQTSKVEALSDEMSSANKKSARPERRVESPEARYERYIKLSVDSARRALRTTQLVAALEGKGEDPVGRVLNVVGKNPILKEYSDRTVFDVNELHRRYPVQVSGPIHNTLYISAYDKFHHGGSYQAQADHRGNGFYWENGGQLLTNAHIIEGSTDLREKKSVDIGLVQLPSHFHAGSEDQILRDDRTISNKDIHGSLVAVVGIDPDDPTSDKETGHKTFLGTAFRLTPEFIYRMKGSLHQKWTDHLANSFALVLPPQEYKKTAVGMSASPVFLHKDGVWKICGAYWASDDIELAQQRKTVSLGFFHGIDNIRGELKRSDLLRLKA